tara:strand:+ start:7576 stop:8613 length:1038 start_codon:yes stop_codon:yes gene_type:complete
MSLTSEEKRKEVATTALKEMTQIASEMRAIIFGMPPQDLLGYIYAQRLMAAGDMDGKSVEGDHSEGQKNEINQSQFLLEYVHAVLASDEATGECQFDEARCTELFDLSRKLREQSMLFAIASSADTGNQEFGPNTAELEFRAKSSWVLLRGNRYQVLENEFYRYVLAPHDDVLTEIYGVGATDIAKGFQDIADATRTGQTNAILVMREQHEAATQYAIDKGKPLEEVMEDWVTDNGERPWLPASLWRICCGVVSRTSVDTRIYQRIFCQTWPMRGAKRPSFLQKVTFQEHPSELFRLAKSPWSNLTQNISPSTHALSGMRDTGHYSSNYWSGSQTTKSASRSAKR